MAPLLTQEATIELRAKAIATNDSELVAVCDRLLDKTCRHRGSDVLASLKAAIKMFQRE